MRLKTWLTVLKLTSLRLQAINQGIRTKTISQAKGSTETIEVDKDLTGMIETEVALLNTRTIKTPKITITTDNMRRQIIISLV